MDLWQLQEIKKCASNFSYFCEKYVRITHPRDGLVPFKLYKFQERIVEEFCKDNHIIVSKFRQAGLTTVASIWCLWRCMFKLDQRIMLMSKTDREAVAVGKNISNIIDNLPEWLRPIMKIDSDHEKAFASTGSIFWFYTPSAARSKSLTYLVIDEAAFIPNMYDQWKAMYPTLAGGGRCIVISTVNGVGGVGAWYYETYTKAKEKKNQFHVIDLNYKEHPEYCKPEWERVARSNLGEKAWAQEFLCRFLDSGDTYINGKIITELEEKCIDPVEKLFPEWDNAHMELSHEEDLFNENYVKGALWIWEEPQVGREYMIAADASEGVGDNCDYSAAIVFDTTNNNMKQVAEFYSNIIPVHKFAQTLAQIGDFYNEALLILESNNGPSASVLNRLEYSVHYPNLYFDAKGRDRPGLNLSRTTRPIVMETLQTCLYNKLVRIRSNRIIHELKTFIYNPAKQRPEAMRGSHDDLTISLALALYVSDIQSRDVPIGMDQMAKDVIAETLSGQSLTEIRKQLEDGLPDDFFDIEEMEEALLLPVLTERKNYHYRPHDALLRDFGI